MKRLRIGAIGLTALIIASMLAYLPIPGAEAAGGPCALVEAQGGTHTQVATGFVSTDGSCQPVMNPDHYVCISEADDEARRTWSHAYEYDGDGVTYEIETVTDVYVHVVEWRNHEGTTLSDTKLETATGAVSSYGVSRMQWNSHIKNGKAALENAFPSGAGDGALWTVTFGDGGTFTQRIGNFRIGFYTHEREVRTEVPVVTGNPPGTPPELDADELPPPIVFNGSGSICAPAEEARPLSASVDEAGGATSRSVTLSDDEGRDMRMSFADTLKEQSVLHDGHREALEVATSSGACVEVQYQWEARMAVVSGASCAIVVSN